MTKNINIKIHTANMLRKLITITILILDLTDRKVSLLISGIRNFKYSKLEGL